MNDFEIMRYFAFGQYFKTNSVFHRLDPRVKLIALLICTGTVMAENTIPILLLGIIGVSACLFLVRIKFINIFRSLLPILPLFIFIFLIQILFYPHQQDINSGGVIALRWNGIIVSWNSLVSIVLMILRMVNILFLILLFSNLVTVSQLTHAIDGLLRPFQQFGLPANEVALVFIITYRFIPLMGQELERLMKAQVARGADFGKGWGIKRIRKTFALFIPLFVAALHRSEELSIAMDARCYSGGRGRTRLVELVMNISDWISLVVVFGLCVFAWVL